MPNRLIHESSPYLQQHAHNPVDWYPWGEEALAKARREDKPIFLSIGYSACHWCHVMARESFADQATADILNQHFISIKVDREERPDLDRVYMSAVQAMTGSGGWPMSVFLTPDGKPFYAGTYFPPEPRHRLPAFREVLVAIAEAWENRRDELLQGSDQVVASVRQQMALRAPEQELDPSATSQAVRSLQRDFDEKHGGWDGAPKFPHPMVIEFLLRFHRSNDGPRALRMAIRSLHAMARGGIYDQLGGGFHRYSVDEQWLVPHFEKMLYDNAQLARVYLHAWQVTDEPLFRAVTEETLDYALREMLDPQGGFYATQSAESEGQEGRFFVWTADQIRDVLGDDFDSFAAPYDVEPGGNWEGRVILTFRGTWQERQALDQARRRLFETRETRRRPERDEKVLISWNGLMLAALAEAGDAFGRDDYIRVARQNGAFLLDELRAPDGRLYHVWQDGQPSVKAYLDDYANLIDGLLALYQATFEPRWYHAAYALGEIMLEDFAAPEGGFFDTSDAHETLFARPRDLQDNAVPSGNAAAALDLLRLSQLAVSPRHAERARQSLRQVQGMAGRYPLGFGRWLSALEYALAETREIAIVGDPESDAVERLVSVCKNGFRPHRVLAVGDSSEQEGTVPLLEDRARIDGHATAYVCVDFTCRQPVTDPSSLRDLLTDPMQDPA